MEGGDSSLSFGELSAPELEAADSQAEDGLSEDVLSKPSLELGGEEMLPADALVLPCSFSLEEEEEVVDRLAFLEEGQESLLLTDSSLDAQVMKMGKQYGYLYILITLPSVVRSKPKKQPASAQ